MRGYLKCYYGYKNRWDELLLFGVLDWIKNHTPVTQLDIQVGDVHWMKKRAKMHKEELNTIGLQLSYIDKNSAWSTAKSYDNYFFGGGEVINDQDSYVLPPKASRKQYIYYFLSKFFTRSGRNYFLQYRNVIRHGQFFLLWGIGKPYKRTTKQLYKKLLTKAKGIITRDTTSYQIALGYNPHTTLYHDFSQYMIQLFRVVWSAYNPSYPADSYILINAQDHTRSDKTLIDIQAFVHAHPDKIPVYFPCDMQDDDKYFAVLSQYIPDLQQYDWTKQTVMQTIALFAHAHAGIGSRLHFLYPLHSFGKTYTSTATKDKVAKLLSPTPIDAL